MTIWLKQSTAYTWKAGPFVDSTDGVTPETALTISQADIRLSKAGGDFAQTNNAAGATHDESGYYDVPLNTTDTGTLGSLRVAITESGALPVWETFMVVPSTVWDGLFGASYIGTNVVQVAGTAQTAGDLKASLTTIQGFVETEVAEILVDTGTTIPGTLATMDAKLDAIDGFIDTQVAAILVDTGTTLPATLASIEGKVDALDTVADAVLVDTNLLVDIEVNKSVTTEAPAGTITNVVYADNGTTPLKTRVFTTATGTRAAAT